MMQTPPPIRILQEMARRGALADYTDAGVVSRPVKIRHARNRKPVKGERPAISLILVADDVAQVDDSQHNMGEIVREMTVDIQIDVDLAAEDSGDDDTGLETLMVMLALFVASLRDPDLPQQWLGGMCDWMRLGAFEPDDRSTPDEGRMTRALTVLYRVRSDDENILLWLGANA